MAESVAGVTAAPTPPSPLPPQPQLFHIEPIDVAEPWQQELVDCHTRLTSMVSGRPQQQVHDLLQQKASESMQLHCELVNGLVYAILTSADSSAMHFQYLNIVSRDRFAHALSRLQLVASAHRFPRIRAEVRTQLLWIMEEMVRMNVPGVELVAMALTRQMRGGDVSGPNLRLCRQMLDFLQSNYEWLTRHPMLVSLAAYAYGRVILDHSGRLAEQQQLRDRESAFVVRLVRERFIECAAIGRDLVRMLQDVAKIPVFRALWRDMLASPRAVSAHFSGIEQLLRTPTPRIFLANRLTFEMESRLLYILENLPAAAYSRNLMWFVHRYLSAPEAESLYSDVIRYIVGVFHPSNAVLASSVVPRYVFLGILMRFIRSQVVASNAKLALFYDWLFYDPKADNIMSIEPGVLIIARSADKYAYLTASFLEFLAYLSDAYVPSMAAEVRASIAQAMQDAVEKGVIPSLLPVFEHPRMDVAAKRYMHQLFPRLVPPVPSSAAEPRQRDGAALPPDVGNSGEEDADPVARMFDDDADDNGDNSHNNNDSDSDAADAEPLPLLLLPGVMAPDAETSPPADRQPGAGMAIHKEHEEQAEEEDLPLVAHDGDARPFASTQEALDDPSLWIFGSALRDYAEKIEQQQPVELEASIREIIAMYAQSEASPQSVAHILSLALADAELEDIEAPRSESDGPQHDILYYIFETAQPFFADAPLSPPKPEPPRRRIAELLVRLTATRVDVGFRWLLYSISSLGCGSSAYRQYVGAYAKGTVRSALARDMSTLQERFPEHFYAVLPSVYSAFPDELVGSCAIIKSVVALIDQPQVYRLCMLISRGKLRLFGNSGNGDPRCSNPRALTAAVGRAMDGDDAFEQVCLWQLLEAELAGNTAAVGVLARYILLERSLELTGSTSTSSNSEAANGLLSLLRSTPPTASIFTILVKYSSVKEGCCSVGNACVDFSGSVLVQWMLVFRQHLMASISTAAKSISADDLELLASRFEERFASDKHSVIREIKSHHRLCSTAQPKRQQAQTVSANGVVPPVTRSNGRRRKGSVKDSRNEKRNSDDDSASDSSKDDNVAKKPKRKKRGRQRGRRQRRIVVIGSEDEDEESASDAAESQAGPESGQSSSPAMYSSSLSSMSSDEND
ncbi:Integrator complex subunit 3 [Coemansia sp. RSA 2559]|nr:Integrator complex subunit 3 [Coemansia sp. RSA 2559]KAJ2862580.1 Integrator complex subunit 3 [Coemansia erecta]